MNQKYFFKRDIWNWKSKPGGVLLMHFSQVVLAWVTLSITIVTLECLLHFVNPTITPIHSLRQGLILSPGTAPPHHFAPQTQWTLLQHHPLHCPGCGHYPTTSPSHTEDVDTILLLSPVLPTILLPPLSSVFSPVHTFSFLVPHTFPYVLMRSSKWGKARSCQADNYVH